MPETDYQREMEHVMSGGKKEELDQEPEGETVEQKILRANAQSQAALQKSNEANLMARLMSDPEISQILQMRQQGKKVKILDADQVQAERQSQEPQTSELAEDESDVKKIMAHYAKGMLNDTKKLIQQELTPLSQRLEEQDRKIKGHEAKESMSEIEAARKKFPDFDNYLDEMSALSSRVKDTLKPEELYTVIKAQKGQPQKRNTTTDSERPTTEATRPSLSKKETVQHGRAGMAELIARGAKQASSEFSD